MQDIPRARNEIKLMIKRKNYNEIPLRELSARTLKSTMFGMRFHLRDMMGGNILKTVNTSIGKIIRLPKNK